MHHPVHYGAHMQNEVPLPQLIGDRVRHERHARTWTLDQLVEMSGVSRRMLINIEQGSANPSIGILLKLSDALGVGLAALVESAEPSGVRLTRRGSGPVLWSSEAGGRAVMVASTVPPEVVELWDWTLGPGDRYASEAHAEGTRELLHVLKGTVLLEAGGETHELHLGDALAFPGDVAHAYANRSRSAARFSLSVYEPAVGTGLRGRVGRA